MDEPLPEIEPPLQRLRQYALAAWREVVDGLTPPLCLSCQTPILRGAALCLTCWPKLHLLDEPVCDALGIPFAYDEGAGALSPAAIADPPHWDKGRAAVAFDEASKNIVHKFKITTTSNQAWSWPE